MMPNDSEMKDLELRRTLRDVMNCVLGIAESPNDLPHLIAAETRFTADLGADSLDVVEILMGVEEAVGIKIPDADMDAIGDEWRAGDFTFEQFVGLVKKHQEANQC